MIKIYWPTQPRSQSMSGATLQEGEGAWHLCKREERRGNKEWIQSYLPFKVFTRNINEGNREKNNFSHFILEKKNILLSINKI